MLSRAEIYLSSTGCSKPSKSSVWIESQWLKCVFPSRCQRPAISPESFFSASWPPWFTPGAQQDCSEYLKYLLDRYVAGTPILEPRHDDAPRLSVIWNADPCGSGASVWDLRDLVLKMGKPVWGSFIELYLCQPGGKKWIQLENFWNCTKFRGEVFAWQSSSLKC